MSFLHALRYRLDLLLRPRRHDAELGDEIDFHLDLESMQHAHRAGDAGARHAARRRFGNVTYFREEARRAAGMGQMDIIWQDVRFALRSFRRAPAFTAIVVGTLGIGIGANTAIFTAFNALLLRPLPFHAPDELMVVALAMPATAEHPARDGIRWSWPKYEVFRAEQRGFQRTSLVFESQFTVRTGDEAIREDGEAVDSDYLPTLGVAPALGRNFVASEDRPGAEHVALISDGLWKSAFNADPLVLGKTMDVDGTAYVVIGVMPRGFSGLSTRRFWIPRAAMPTVWTSFGVGPYDHTSIAIARRAPNVSVEMATALAREAGVRVDAAYPSTVHGEHWSAATRDLNTIRIGSGVRRSLLLVFGAVALVLMIACANVANLLLVRASGRRREIAVRLAIGASRRRLVRQLLVESSLLALAGGAVGLGVAWLGEHLLFALGDGNLVRISSFDGVAGVGLGGMRIDAMTFAFTAGLAVLTGIVFGLAPALQATRPALTEALTPEARPRLSRLRGITARNVLTVVELALAVVLLVGSGLMLRSLDQLLRVRTGFDADHLLTLRVNRAPRWSRDSITRFYDVALGRLATIPGVTRVALSDCAPLEGGCGSRGVVAQPDRAPYPPGAAPRVGGHWVTPDWFAVMRAPVIRGRVFDVNDRVDTRKGVVVNEAAARRLWPGEDPIGRPLLSIGYDHDTAYVIGVVGDMRYDSVDEPPQPEIYVSYYQAPISFRMMVFVRTDGDAASLAPAVRSALREVAPGFPVYDVSTMRARVSDALAYETAPAALLGLFAIIAIVLAALGIYGVVSFGVAQRTRELSVRVALGATGADLTRLVVGQGFVLGAAGLGCGVVASLAATRVMRTMLYGVAPTDPVTYGAIVIVLAIAVLAACWIPARRAAGVAPIEALRAG